MKKLGFLIATATMLLACSGSKNEPTTPEEPTTEASTRTAPVSGWETDPSADSSATDLSGDRAGMDSEQAATAEPIAPPAPEEPATPTAMANLVSIKDGSAMGTVTFEQDGNVITMAGTFTGLPPGERAIYIHEVGDCTKKGKAIGRHLDPTKAKHGPPSSGTRHAGDLGNVVVDPEGNASFQMITDSVVMEEGRADSILRRAIVIHAKKDDASGKVNAPLACGVIEMVEGDASRTTDLGRQE